ncbi:MAG: hypothetical protein Q7K65_00310 [Candidatus Buchananbacteria bacterium]|nr:hypothetical protein [Candidatus Buchananbacteria bacterium]
MEGENQFNNNQSAEYLQDENQDVFLQEEGSISVDKRSAKEKAVVALVLVVSFFAVILGITQFSSSLRKPVTDLMLLAGQDTSSSSDALAILAQQQKDTDGDGLSDYDELSVYGTSPYLADSDSDGVSDKEEITAGHDPNCSTGDNCFRTEAVYLNQNLNSGSGQTLLLSGSDPQALRALLLQNGFPQDQLDKITDDQLLTTYQQALAGQNPADSTNVNSSGLNSIDDLKNLTGAQIRQLMIEQGASAEILSQVSDEELKTMFLTKLNAESN